MYAILVLHFTIVVLCDFLKLSELNINLTLFSTHYYISSLLQMIIIIDKAAIRLVNAVAITTLKLPSVWLRLHLLPQHPLQILIIPCTANYYYYSYLYAHSSIFLSLLFPYHCLPNACTVSQPLSTYSTLHLYLII